MVDSEVLAIDRAWLAWRELEAWRTWLGLAGCLPRALADKGLEVTGVVSVVSHR